MALTTKAEVIDIRVERVLPYLANASGVSLDALLIAIDNGLKDSSPDAMSPGLINWSKKGLFVDKWTRVSGTGTLTYNQFGASKIGKGRYEISETGIFEYNRFVPVSDTRGATAKIYFGANNLATTVNVGIRCYDENQVYLGTNGGFVANAVTPVSTNVYSFYKSTAFGESASSIRSLKPNTRYVKFYIELISNGGICFFDESELTTFELDERYLQIFSNIVDWNTAEYFYSELSANTIFAFNNDQDGKVKTFFIKNNSVSNINVTFPVALWQGGLPLTLIRAGKQSGFTFIKAGGKLYASVIEELE